jgi:surfeit locus 1 family protein
MRRLFLPLLFGLTGVAILVGLGTWQVQRLAWKSAILAEIEAQIAADPVPLLSGPLEQFQAVEAEGLITGEEAHVLTSVQGMGAAFRIVSAFETGGRRVLLDRGAVPVAEKDAPRPPVEARITGNFRTVQETDSFTPEPDLARNYWFARDVPAMAAALDTEPLLVILRTTSETDPPVTPQPVNTAGIANNHLQYALTWFSLALAWAGMTGLWLWRITRRTD